ncbi:MAG: twin-arginine translocase subunit TatC [Syntrophomonadaceae bacterium]|nr:twin-arginine translocase subunit TatC [Syntrophomonadaceae bacterium]MDD3271804.1 twin-arginine translocase subunit TatC [Syntrophomonadaceae bacterium]MDD3897983.1 twin-arginine translocase subunit TatC [Syntrophomonadaceae bacterium]MDD4562527.1 twin-arginine translocase subunit TatC [Syntrophomonadaceae bacterium]
MALRDMSAEDKQTIIEHLEALRTSLIIAFVAIIVAAVFCFYYSEQILTIIASPLRSLNENLVVTGVTEAFFVKLKLSFYGGFIIAFPVVVWAFWRFIKPALYPSERKYVYIFIPLAVGLFTIGVLFAYFGILRLVLNFFIYIAGENLETMFKVDQYVSFVLAFTIPFGLVFELPVVVFFLTKLGIVKYEAMARNRKYALLVIVILAAALTPGPDPISQMMMAGPVYLLYEISIWVSKYAKPRKTEVAEETE